MDDFDRSFYGINRRRYKGNVRYHHVAITVFVELHNLHIHDLQLKERTDKKNITQHKKKKKKKKKLDANKVHL